MYRATLTPESTPQQVFDHIVNATIAGSFPSYNFTDSQCEYRGQNGKACIAGIFIPDDKYCPTFENDSIDSLFRDRENALNPKEYPEFMFEPHPESYKLDFEGLDKCLFEEMQVIHDTQDMGKWDSRKFLDAIYKLFREFMPNVQLVRTHDNVTF